MQKRLVTRRSELPNLTKKEINLITRNLIFQNDLKDIYNAQILFVFGVSRKYKECVGRVNSLLASGFKGTLILTGGIPQYEDSVKISEPESGRIYDLLDKRLLNSGIKIILEKKSQNSLENVINSLPQLEAIDYSTIAMVSSVGHNIRAFLTLKSYIPKGKEILRYTYFPEGINNKINWEDVPDLREKIASELKRIQLYSEKGDLDLKLARQLLTQKLLDKFKSV